METLENKIVKLFEYRHLPHLMKVGNDGILDEAFYKKLIELQANIYHLDHVLESDWTVDMEEIDHKWVAIHKSLLDLGVPHVKINEYCRHIYKYQKHELEIREGRLPLRFKMEYFYFYKSCDVKLIRRLIYDRYTSLKRIARLSEWRVFDLITEIDDDIEDIYEDLTTINGNRFLLSILKHGKEKTAEQFSIFLNELGRRAEALTPSTLNHKELSLKVYTDTRKLFMDRIKGLDMSRIESAKIGSHI